MHCCWYENYSSKCQDGHLSKILVLLDSCIFNFYHVFYFHQNRNSICFALQEITASATSKHWHAKFIKQNNNQHRTTNTITISTLTMKHQGASMCVKFKEEPLQIPPISTLCQIICIVYNSNQSSLCAASSSPLCLNRSLQHYQVPS